MRRPLCGNLRLHAHDLSSKSGAAPTRKKKACSSLVTASMNEKQLEGMLHYHPISNAGGGVLTLL